MITCRYCKTDKPTDEFYQSAIRKNGTGDCKECIRSRVKANRAKNADYYKQFDRDRANLPHRVQARKDYQATEQGQKAMARGNKAWRSRNPASYQAHSMVNNAMRDGKLFKPSQCEGCNDETTLHGHHCDYNKPLDVMWLCDPCHKQWHRENEPIYCNEAQEA